MRSSRGCALRFHFEGHDMNAASALIDAIGQQRMRARVLENCAPIPFTGCWIWEGALGNSGYGKTRFTHVQDIQAHRLAYAAWHGHIPEGMCVLHSCDVRCCVNPVHLSLGTKRENSRQMVDRGRNFSPASTRTHCPQGHAYSGSNSQGRRICRICNLAATKRWNLKQRKSS
jgi:hypothetical protein